MTADERRSDAKASSCACTQPRTIEERESRSTADGDRRRRSEAASTAAGSRRAAKTGGDAVERGAGGADAGAGTRSEEEEENAGGNNNHNGSDFKSDPLRPVKPLFTSVFDLNSSRRHSRLDNWTRRDIIKSWVLEHPISVAEKGTDHPYPHIQVFFLYTQ